MLRTPLWPLLHLRAWRQGLQWALVSVLVLAGLTGCGFHLRNSLTFAFQTLAITPERGPAVAVDLARYLGDAVVPLTPAEGKAGPQAVLDILGEQREKIVVGVNASGQVREFQLRLGVKFRLRTPKGEDLIPVSEIVQTRDISFNESAVLAKEAEEGLLYRDMQTDIVQQLLRRLAAVKSIN